MKVQVVIEVEAEKIFSSGLKYLGYDEFTVVDIHSINPPPPTLCRVELTATGEHGIMVIKTIREYTGLGLKESKDLFDNVRNGNFSIIKKELGEVEAKMIQRALEAAGGSARIINY